MNKLAARAMRAKMMGRMEEAADLEAELHRAKAALVQAPPPPPKPLSLSAAGGEVEVGVPNAMVGMLVGKEGASIAALRKESGARIKITDHTDESGKRIVKLGGTPAQVQCIV